MVTQRSATGSDIDALRIVLAMAADWRSATTPTLDAAILAEPDVARYLADWPRLDDFGVIALDGDEPIGAAWWRYFASTDPGYGFVAPDIPELTIAVHPEARGRGTGTALLERLIDAARERSVPALSLSVAADNPARRLYERCGFRAAGDGDGSITMVLVIE